MLKIGPIVLNNRLLLAPMAGITDLPFRKLCRDFGAALAFGEMITADQRLWRTEKTKKRLCYAGEPRPLAAQLLGSEPQALAEAARALVDQGVDLIDLNLGCPAKKVCRTGSGAALLRRESQVGRILETLVNAVPVPITLKIRTGWSPAERNALQIARIARESGVAALSIHGRTARCSYGEPAEYETIRAVKAAMDLPIIANGDIDSPQKALWVLHHTGADGLMIGRAARGRPWLFREILQALGEALPPWNPVAVMEAHLNALCRFYGRERGLRIARKHRAWYAENLQDFSSAQLGLPAYECHSSRTDQRLR